ncbi:hypothetical protein AOLI_G00183820 [Acnodon oligacanthus]
MNSYILRAEPDSPRCLSWLPSRAPLLLLLLLLHTQSMDGGCYGFSGHMRGFAVRYSVFPTCIPTGPASRATIGQVASPTRTEQELPGAGGSLVGVIQSHAEPGAVAETRTMS